jgi:hypothetical protein
MEWWSSGVVEETIRGIGITPSLRLFFEHPGIFTSATLR